MAYRYGNREQQELFPQSIEDYVAEDDPVRAYDAFVEALDFNSLGIVLDENKVGNPEYNPKAMLKLLIYGPSYGIRSSRKLERAIYHNLSFIWLLGGLKPDHKTISTFRRNNKNVLKNVLKQCAQMCIKLDLIAGNCLFVDGSKIKANASIKNTWTKEKIQEYLKEIDQHIETLIDECETIDSQEQNQPSLVKLNKEIGTKQTIKAKVQAILTELKQGDKKSLNSTDKECTMIKNKQGTHVGYSAQSVVDEKHGLIVNADVVSENNDANQFANQIEQANEVLGKKCNIACADAGYSNVEQLKQIDQQDIKVIVPSKRQVSKKTSREFDTRRFIYDSTKDCYTCPQGHKLIYSSNDGKAKRYRIEKSSNCRYCIYFGKCAKNSRDGRRINRLIDEETRLRLEAQYLQPESQAIYKLRKHKVEIPFGHIKHNLGVKDFLLRGIDGVRAEISVLATCFNISRMINLFSVRGFIEELMPIK